MAQDDDANKMLSLVRQQGNQVKEGGALAGRDITYDGCSFSSTTVLSHPRTVFQQLNIRYKSQLEQNASFAEIIPAIQHYSTQVDTTPVAGLEPKLTAVGWDADMIADATRKKELFAKKLAQHMLTEAAQNILGYLLGTVYTNFESHVRPLLARKAPDHEISAAIHASVVVPAFRELEENVLFVHFPEIEGALYYLTGNCHITWRKKVA